MRKQIALERDLKVVRSVPDMMLAKSSTEHMPLSSRYMIHATARDFYGATLETLLDTKLPFVVGGAFALRHFAGIHRDTKDLDVFMRQEHVAPALAALEAQGFTTEVTFPHWLAKAYCRDHFVDFIFNSANGLCPVDEAWFATAERISLLDREVLLCPIEEVIWTKAFVMERERFDGADICHLIEACGPKIDWRRLIDRFGPHWRVLFGHLVFFSFVYPSRRERIPAWVLDELLARFDAERENERDAVCRGTLVSREQYLPDLRGRGFGDARVPPWGVIPQPDIDVWTDAIGKVK